MGALAATAEGADPDRISLISVARNLAVGDDGEPKVIPDLSETPSEPLANENTFSPDDDPQELNGVPKPRREDFKTADAYLKAVSAWRAEPLSALSLQERRERFASSTRNRNRRNTA